MKAVINGDRIECGKCGALLAKIEGNATRFSNEAVNNMTDVAGYNNDSDRCGVSVKCKHKDKGVTCNTINEILL